MGIFEMKLLQIQAKEYRLANRTKRRDIITEHCKLTGASRNTAVKRFSRAILKTNGFKLDNYQSANTLLGDVRARGAPKKYTESHFRLVLLLNDLAGNIAAERIKPQINEYLIQLDKAGILKDYSEEVVDAIRYIPVISLKRIFKELGIKRKRRKLPALSNIASQIPIQSHFGQFSNLLGYVALDYVEHNGGNCSGRFVQSGCYVDIATQWTVRAAGWGRNVNSVGHIHKIAMTRIHHHIRHFHTDNAPAAMKLLFEKLSEIKTHYQMSRSRPYKKNDNAHVEQKNGDKIRKLVGYWRLDTQDACDILNELYAIEDLISNYFIASAKLIYKEYDEQGKVIRKHYDSPKTPYERLLTHPNINNKTKCYIIAEKKSLNLIELRQHSIELQAKLSKYYGVLR